MNTNTPKNRELTLNDLSRDLNTPELDSLHGSAKGALVKLTTDVVDRNSNGGVTKLEDTIYKVWTCTPVGALWDWINGNEPCKF